MAQTAMRTLPVLDKPIIDGSDARLFPGVKLGFFSMGDVLVPVERGEMVQESLRPKSQSYWRVIPQFGRMWKEKGDGDWSRAAFPIMLVNDTENHAHQGLATFLYRPEKSPACASSSSSRPPPISFPSTSSPGDSPHATLQPAAPATSSRCAPRPPRSSPIACRHVLGANCSRPRRRVPSTGSARRWRRKWVVITAIVRDGTLYYGESRRPTAHIPTLSKCVSARGRYLKSVGVPLALLRLGEVYGPFVLNLENWRLRAGGRSRNTPRPLHRCGRHGHRHGRRRNLKTNPNDI